MARKFFHKFDPPEKNPVSEPEAGLTVREIEDAGLREVLQTPGAHLGSWSMIGPLLAPGDLFVFREPLGHSREVKVALSGLFGRFVARAYLERYFNLSIFASIGRSPLKLDGQRSIEVCKCGSGDLPDWVAAASFGGDLTVAEAKGSHDPSGPARALKRAWEQAGRVTVQSNGKPATVKRIAIVTRWGMRIDGPSLPWISVRDPIEKGHQMERDEMDAAFVGLFRHHVASLIAPLGHEGLAESLRDISIASNERDKRRAVVQANDFLDGAYSKSVAEKVDLRGMDRLIGGIVTRAGPMAKDAISRFDPDLFARLDLRPVFVGIDPDLVHATVEGDASSLRDAIRRPLSFDEEARGDQARGWIIPLGGQT